MIIMIMTMTIVILLLCNMYFEMGVAYYMATIQGGQIKHYVSKGPT